MKKTDPTGTTALSPASFEGASAVASAVRAARSAQSGWAAQSIQSRLKVLRRFRALLADRVGSVAALLCRPGGRPVEEVLTAQVIPLLEGIRFLERRAPAILATRKLGRRGRPLWLSGAQAEVRREPLGVILVVGPSNYPLFLPSVQALQALAAGNAVLLKPGLGGAEVMQLFVSLLHHAGLDHRLAQVLPEDAAAAASAINVGVDKVILTGSAATGRAVSRQLADHLTPSVMELSGADPVIVRGDADLDLTVRALRFGSLLNNGATCIAPRRVFVHQSISTELEGRLAQAFAGDAAGRGALRLKPEWSRMIHESLSQGAHLVSGALLDRDRCVPPLVLAGKVPALEQLHADGFLPVLALMTVADDHEALALARRSPYALGASIFGRDLNAAKRLAGQLEAGVVVINDMIVPTADPRLPFAGRGESGFGVTRGEEGLLELTAPKAVVSRRSRWLPHLEGARVGDGQLFETYILAAHALGWKVRGRAVLSLARAVFQRWRRDLAARAA